jgi:predicted nucleic acid-binding Zn ribbon protein
MPIYVYEPTVYSAEDPYNECCFFETLQSLSEAPLTQCPTCGNPVHKALTTFAVTQGTRDASRLDAMPGGGGGVGWGSDAAKGSALGELFQKSSSSPSSQTGGGRAARMAMRHICGGGCRH